jgi:F-type H+-transporting ATPase subunit b
MADPAATATAAGQGAGGLPQFDLAQWPGQMVWVLAIFAILYVLFAKVFVPGVGGAIDAREAKIAGDIAEARRLKSEAEDQAKAAAGEMDASRERARKVAADAKAEAKSAAARRRAEEAGRLAKGFADAEARIAAAKSEAMGHVRAIAAGTALAMIERLTGAAATTGEIDLALGVRPAAGRA